MCIARYIVWNFCQAIYDTAVSPGYHLAWKRLYLEYCFMGKGDLWLCVIVFPLHVGASHIHWIV